MADTWAVPEAGQVAGFREGVVRAVVRAEASTAALVMVEDQAGMGLVVAVAAVQADGTRPPAQNESLIGLQVFQGEWALCDPLAQASQSLT